MDNFPSEVWTEIFLFCNRTDLLNLTLVCKNFNEIISNNSKLMDSLYIIMRRNFPEGEFVGNRKYCNLRVTRKPNQFTRVIDLTKDNLTSMRLLGITMGYSELKGVLLKCSKLKNLLLSSDHFIYTDDAFEEPLPRLDLDKLDLTCDRTVLKILMNCQVKFITSFRVRNHPGEIDAFQMFLKNQKKLETIHFNHFINDTSLFDDDTLAKVDFKLKALIIQDFTEFEIENFLKFLRNHRDSLEKMELSRWRKYFNGIEVYHTAILDNVRDFPRLKTLRLQKVSMNFKPLPFVENLTLVAVGFGKTKDWSANFPNVKKIHFESCTTFNTFEDFKKLEALQFSNYTMFEEIRLPLTVKTFQLYMVWHTEEGPIDIKHHQLENIILEECGDADWLGRILINLKKNLNYLKLQRVRLSGNRRFGRLFEKKPKLKYKAKHFVFDDSKFSSDESSIDEAFFSTDEDDDELACGSSNAKKLKIE